jgi:hypothetical protein
MYHLVDNFVVSLLNLFCNPEAVFLVMCDPSMNEL